MDLYPAIDLRGGRVVRLRQGDFEDETVYGHDPISVAHSYENAGAPWVHIVDLDAARGTGSNRSMVGAVAGAVRVRVQTGGGVRSAADAEALFRAGVARVVVGSAAVDDPDFVETLVNEHPRRVAVGLDHLGGEVRTRGWEEGSGQKLLDVAVQMEQRLGAGLSALVVTDISRDGELVGPDLDGYKALLSATSIPIIASGGVATLEDLRALRDLGLSGVIVGKAFYEERFTVEDAVAAST